MIASGPLVVFWLGVGLACVVLSALYSGLETGVYCLNRIRLRIRTDSRDRTARVLHNLVRDTSRLLIVLLICNNIANYGTTAAVAVLLASTGLTTGGAELIVILIVTPLLFVWGEMVPKTLFRRHSETLVYHWTWLLRVSSLVTTYCGMVGLVRAISYVLLGRVRREAPPGGLLSSRQQIRGMLVETAHSGVLTGRQKQIAENVLALHQVRLRDVMVPRHAVETIASGVSRDQFLSIARSASHSRLPVHPPDRPSRITGVATLLDGLLLDPNDFTLDKCCTEVPKLPPSSNVQTALTRLQRARQPMGLVVDKSGRCLGIVTIKDLVEEIVGELRAW
jgi:putative hemolysin